MTRKFYFHPDRRKDVMSEVLAGRLPANLEQLVACKYLPLTNSQDVPVLGFWVEEYIPEDFTLPMIPLPVTWPRLSTRYEPRR